MDFEGPKSHRHYAILDAALERCCVIRKHAPGRRMYSAARGPRAKALEAQLVDCGAAVNRWEIARRAKH